MTAPRTPRRPAIPRQRIPAGIWLPESFQSAPAAQRNPSTLLPLWALDRVRTEFCIHPNRPEAPQRRLLHTVLSDTTPGMDARARCTPIPAELTPMSAKGPNLALLAELLTPYKSFRDAGTAADDAGWPGFFHRAHRLLRGGGLLLIASRQHHSRGRLADPCGALIACARTAGFTYLQHIIVVHAAITGDNLTLAPDAPAPAPDDSQAVYRVLHTDLLVFHAAADRA